MNNRIRAWFAFLVCAPLLAGCATTGDPRQGGLFGWSEDKAAARQEQLMQNDQLARQQLANEQQRMAALGSQRALLATETARLQAELGRLLEENRMLDTQLRGLMQRRQLRQDHVARLQKMLNDNEQLRVTAHERASNRTQPAAPAQVRAISDQNAQLHREVMILLQR